jgi:hypothetical protein
MSNWRIPPVGWCVTCLIAFGEENAAMALWKGNSLCKQHLRDAVAPELEEELEKRGYEVPEEGWTPPTDPESDPVRRSYE